MLTEDVKWIKLTTNMFDDEKIRLLEAMPSRDTLIVIWIKLLTQAGKTNAGGYIYLSENIPYTEAMLATVFRRPLRTVQLALATFVKMGMVEWEGDRLFIPNFGKHQNIEGLARIREQGRQKTLRYRDRLSLVGGDSYRPHTGMVMARDGHKCVYCGSEENLVVDHLIPLILGGDNEPDNLVAACRKCNSGKAGRLVEDARYTFIAESTASQYQAVKVRLGHGETLRDPIEVEGEERENKKENTTTTTSFEGIPIPGWDLAPGDLEWFEALRGDFKDFTEGVFSEEMHRCLDYHSGRKVPAHKGIWKNRLRNWMRQAQEIRAKKRANAHAVAMLRPMIGRVDSNAELDALETNLEGRGKP